MKSVLLLMLRGYQYMISPMLGQNCRFYPSCSAYAAQAIQEYGAAKGSLMAAKRLCKCHPWHEGGVDLVPPKMNSEHDHLPDCELGMTEVSNTKLSSSELSSIEQDHNVDLERHEQKLQDQNQQNQQNQQILLSQANQASQMANELENPASATILVTASSKPS